MLALVASLTIAASPCAALADAAERARRSRDQGVVNEATTLLPGPLAERVRAEVGRAGVDGALVMLDRAVVLTCPPVAAPPSSARLRDLMASDGRFVGVRADDVSARLLDRFWAFVEGLLESEAMQRFSEHTRTVYVTLLCLVCAFVGFRVWRRSRLVAASNPDDGVVVGLERRRVAAFAALRDEARAALEASPRQALLLLRRALLARVGEHDEGAVRPSRTTSEILERLDAPASAAVGPALSRFDVAFYGGDVSVEAARALIDDVDAAVAALARATGAGGGR